MGKETAPVDAFDEINASIMQSFRRAHGIPEDADLGMLEGILSGPQTTDALSEGLKTVSERLTADEGSY
jgi:hypothetical protein